MKRPLLQPPLHWLAGHLGHRRPQLSAGSSAVHVAAQVLPQGLDKEVVLSSLQTWCQKITVQKNPFLTQARGRSQAAADSSLPLRCQLCVQESLQHASCLQPEADMLHAVTGQHVRSSSSSSFQVSS